VFIADSSRCSKSGSNLSADGIAIRSDSDYLFGYWNNFELGMNFNANL